MGSGSTKDIVETEPLECLDEHGGRGINCMALSEDGSLLVTGGDDCIVRMWSTRGEKMDDLGLLSGHTGFIQCVTIFDTFVVSGSKDTTVRLWDMASSECIFVYEGHTGRINRLICTGEFIFSTSHDKTLRAWLFDTIDVDDPGDACIRVFEGHTNVVSPVIFIPGQALGTVDEQGLNINPGDTLITGSFDTTARTWSFDTGGPLKVFKGHNLAITCMDVDPKGVVLYTGAQDKTIIAWDLTRGTIMKKVEDAHGGAVLHLRVVHRLIYTCGTDHVAKCWTREGLELTREYKDQTDSLATAKFHNNVLYTACNDGGVRAFDARSGALKKRFQGHRSAVTCLAVCVNDHMDQIVTRVISGGNDGKINVWNATGISEETPELPQPTREYDQSQNTKLYDLERRLSDYFPSTANTSVTASPAPDLEIIHDLE